MIGLHISIHIWVHKLSFCFVLFLTYYSVECQTKSLINLCVRFAMFPIFLAILKFCTIQRMFFFSLKTLKFPLVFLMINLQQKRAGLF